MKNLLTLIAIVFIIHVGNAQKKIVWFDTGIKVQYGAAGLYNAAISDSEVFDHTIGKGLSYGGKIGVNFYFGGFSLDVMKSKIEQDFKNFTTKTNPTVSWESTDIYLMYRNAKNLGYFEIGPKLSMISKVQDNFDGSVVTRTIAYNKNVFSGVVGFGANIIGNDGRFSGILGLRFEYGFSDFVTADGKKLGAPVNDPSIYTTKSAASNIAFAGVVFELNWGIGYFGRAQCGARSKFIMF